MKTQHSDTTLTRVLIWDLPVRLFHWIQLALFVSLFITAEVMDDKIELHAQLGLVMLALVLFRLLWGFFGSSYARFNQFVKGPRTVLTYLPSLFSRQRHFTAGHNPLGGWMAVTLLLLVLVQATFGLFTNDDILFEGPLAHLVSEETSDLFTEFHEVLFHVLLVLVGLHIVAVIWHTLFKNDDLLSTMFSGYKSLPSDSDMKDLHGGRLLRALILLIISSGMVYLLTSL